MSDHTLVNESNECLAIVGMAGRFPGAASVEQFWENLRRGVESVTFFTDDELLAAGTIPEILHHPQYVKAKGVLADVDLFDAQFFGYTPQEARVMDPQHRIFLECGWHALEDAGYRADTYAGSIGVFAGANFNQYVVRNVFGNPAAGPVSAFDKDFLATRLSYKLDLKGPSLVIQTACSTSLVAVAQACQSLLTYQCDMALAGGIAVHLPSKMGYLYQEGGILSPDGHCRAFDAKAHGTVIGSGVGIVVLKRLADAIADGDSIRAVVRGFAVNNDGSAKMGYMAPSIDGQAQVVAMAQALAGVSADSVGYIEAHGTGTELGDPIEIAALTQAFRATTARTQFCAIGSVKTNVGHLDSAAGVAGLIKAALSLQHREIAPSLHFEQSNPKIDFPSSPFYVSTELRPWSDGPTPRRAGVSSFGIGGTNVHLVLEEAPPAAPSTPSGAPTILVLSARTPAALDTAAANLADYLEQHPAVSLTDVAYTLQVGRKPFATRRALVCRDVPDAVRQLRAASGAAGGASDEAGERSVVFVFPAGPLPAVEHAGELSRSHPAFREALDRCAAARGGEDGALFAFEYALAQLFLTWGIRPAATVGEGVGELVAACVAGVMSVEEALALLARHAASPGAAPLDGGDPVRIERRDPAIPVGSAATGSWLSDDELRDGSRWAERALARTPGSDHQRAVPIVAAGLYVELGPGDSLTALLRGTTQAPAIPVLRADPAAPAAECLAGAIGRLWASGVEPSWNALYPGERRQRVPLPQYPFERQRYWVERAPAAAADPAVQPATIRSVDGWFYVPAWHRAVVASTTAPVEAPCVVFTDDSSLATRLVDHLRGLGSDVISVRAGARWQRVDDRSFVIDPASRADYERLLEDLRTTGRVPRMAVHLGGASDAAVAEGERLDRELAHGFYSVLHLVQALGGRQHGGACRLCVFTAGAARVADTDAVHPGRAAVTGLCRVVPYEYPALSCRTIDVVPAEWADADAEAVDRLSADLCSPSSDAATAYRNRERRVEAFRSVPVDPNAAPRLKTGGTYLITGGLGAVGLTLAGYLASSFQARLVLVGRRGLPPRSEWGSRRSAGAADVVAARLGAIERLESAGSVVVVEAADVADEQQMRDVVGRARSRFGRIDGVIHAAGAMAPQGFRPIRDLDRAACEAHFGPKIRGVEVLARLFGNDALDFCVLTSSLSSVLGGLGFAGYAAANAFMDAFARQAPSGWISAAWDGWRFGDAAGRSEIAPQEGIEAFRRLVGSSLRDVVVSTSDLAARMKRWAEAGGVRPAAHETATAAPTVLHPRPHLRTEYVAPRTDLELTIAAAWRDVLGVDPIGVEDNFFELGGDSFLGLQVIAALNQRLGRTISPVALYEGPTVAALGRLLEEGASATGAVGPAGDRTQTPAAGVLPERSSRRGTPRQETSGARGGAHVDVAVIGMSGRFPGARTLQEFWQNLRNGVESRTVFGDEELIAAGIPAQMLASPRFVRSGFVLDAIDQFDADFFGINPREADVLDPQHRLFLECAWEALEHAGYDSETYRGTIGIFGGAALGSYASANVFRNPKVVKAMGLRQSAFGSVPDYMITRVAYKLNLKGPAYFVQTACSTSLVAVHLGCQSLASGESDMVLAGGVTISLPHGIGYTYEEGGMLSPDGVLRAFDASARGTVFGSGAGLVVLKRLDDALADGDTIYAVIKGGATNNDGSLKVGFTAPGVAGQAQVVVDALARAGVSPETISYVEAHGTGTELGDPIEVAALTRAYRQSTALQAFCAIGSVKPNIGHLDAAAGVSSLIKTVLALQHGELPPSINFERPNPAIDFEGSPFFVNTALRPWTGNGHPRRAGVSSFGFGGTNAHLIVEEAPVPEPTTPSRATQVLALSARTRSALDAASSRLAAWLAAQPDVSLPDVAFTLQAGRRAFRHRRAIVCGTAAEAIEALQSAGAQQAVSGEASSFNRRVVFLFPGQGSQYANMGLGLYQSEAAYRAVVDECCEHLGEHLDFDLRAVLYPDPGAAAEATAALQRTKVTQLALFVTEYALARLWMSWGVIPSACLGHSIGELVAACLAGVMPLRDALRIVALRGRLMEEMPEGSMVAVPLGEHRVASMLGEGLWLAAVNSPSMSVVSGRREAIARFTSRLKQEGITSRELLTSHAFHSGLMDDAVAPFVRGFAGVELSRPAIPFVSNVTGDWISPELATDPTYWGQQIRQPVRFGDGLRRLLEASDQLLLEVGPGNTLATLARQQIRGEGGHVVLSSLRHPLERAVDDESVLHALARLWLNGAAVDWAGFHAHERRRRIALPTYPFERRRHWVDPDLSARPVTRRSRQSGDLADWFYVPSWRRTAAPAVTPGAGAAPDGPALLFVDAGGVGDRVAARLAGMGRPVISVEEGSRYSRLSAERFTIAPGSRADYVTLLGELRASDRFPVIVGHLWGVTGLPSEDEVAPEYQSRGFYSLLYLAQAVGEVAPRSPLRIGVVTDGVHDVTGGEPLTPEKATVLGPCRVIPQEFPQISCRHIDIASDPATRGADKIDRLVQELLADAPEEVVALRRGRRWVQSYEPMHLTAAGDAAKGRLRRRGVYLVTGGTGGIGLVLAKYLAQAVEARLVLTSRRGLPPRETWGEYEGRDDGGEIARKIAIVREIEGAGGEVMICAADVTSESAMRRVVDQAIGRFGPIAGVIHAAGVAGGGMVQLKQADVAAAVLAPKVTGSIVLARVFEKREPDFLVLCSSLTSILGGVGQIDYCGANAFLDAFAEHHSATSRTATVAMNWPAWREVGMAVETAVPDDLKHVLKDHALAAGITNAQGVDAFCRVLARPGEHQVAVCQGDVETLLEDARAARAAAQSDVAVDASAEREDAAAHPRPSLQTPYAAPRTEVERTISAIWQDSLGIAPIGIDDNFFELGGHSFLAVTVMGRMNAALGSDIAVARLYDGLTVRFLASLIEQSAQPEAAGAAELDRAERRKDIARRQKEHQQRRRAVMGR